MTVKVKWAIFDLGEKGVRLPGLQVACLAPESLLKIILSNRDKSHYLKCYAFLESLKNTYVIKAPVDVTIQFNRETNWLSVNGISQEVYDGFFINRANNFGEKDPAIVSCLPTHVFYSDVDVQMNVWPVPLLGEVENTRVIVGGFNIAKWIRPLEWAFEIVDDTKSITIKRGDPLYAVVFTPKNNEKVELERVEFNPSLLNAVSACTNLKKIIEKTPLHKCYEMAEGFLQVWRKNRK